jgi:hypothetical protein
MTTLRHFALVVLFVTVTFASQNVVYKCEPVNLTTCATGWQFRVTGGYETKQLNYTVCTNTSATCTVGVSHTFNMQTCAIDFKGDACSTGICFMYPVFQICAKSILTCPNSFTVNYSCINCANTAGCVKCVNKITTNPGQTATTS